MIFGRDRKPRLGLAAGHGYCQWGVDNHQINGGYALRLPQPLD